MSGFWDKKGIKTQEVAYQEAERATPMQLDDEAVSEMLQEDSNVNLFEEEEEDTAAIMLDANLRLEQGRLYQMILINDIFANTDADPRAIKNVQREIRKFVRDRMETMLGIRQEQATLAPIISSPFNDTEVVVLKMLASKMSKGATEQVPVPVAPSQPKKDGITAISGNLRPNLSPISPKKVEEKPTQQVKKAPDKQKQVPTKSAISSVSESALQKPIDSMTSEELVEYNRQAEERSKQKYAQMPTNLVPHPSPQQLEMINTMAAQNTHIANPWRTS